MATAIAPTDTTTTAPAALGLDAELTALRLKAETQLATLARESATSGEEPPLSAIAKLATAAGISTDAAVARFRKMVAAVHDHAVEMESVVAYERHLTELLKPHGGKYEVLVKAVEEARAKFEAVQYTAALVDNSVLCSLELSRYRAAQIAQTYPQLFPS